MPQEGPSVRLPLHSTEWSVTHSLAITHKNCLQVISPYSIAAKSLQSCLTLCDPIDGSPPGSPIPGILRTRILEWVAISFSNAWKWKVKVKSLSRIQLLATPWTAAHQAPASMGFSRQDYWSGLPCSPSGYPPDSGLKPMFPMSPALASRLFTHWSTWEARPTQRPCVNSR